MSELVPPPLEAVERQNRFVSENLRRIFVPDLPHGGQRGRCPGSDSGSVHQGAAAAGAAQGRREGGALAFPHRHQYGHRFSAAARARDASAKWMCRRESRRNRREDLLLRSEHRDYLEDGLRLLDGARARGADAARCRRLLRRRKWRNGWIVPKPRCVRTLPTRASNCGATWPGGGADVSKHPSEANLALFGGGELSGWQRWSVERHVDGCAACRGTISEFSALREKRAGWRKCPMSRGILWRRRCSANIRLGLEAGECVHRASRETFGIQPSRGRGLRQPRHAAAGELSDRAAGSARGRWRSRRSGSD